MNTTQQYLAVKDAVQESVASGSDVHEKIKAITLKALTEGHLDIENIKNVAESVSSGIQAGLGKETGQAKEIFGHAASALDEALAIAAEASKLAIEEASSRISGYSHHDINRATEDLQGMEAVFLDALEKLANSNQMFTEIVGDFVNHARKSGTAVGKQTLTAVQALKELPHWGKESVVSNTLAATITLAQIGSGFLSGIAESLQPPSHKH